MRRTRGGTAFKLAQAGLLVMAGVALSTFLGSARQEAGSGAPPPLPPPGPPPPPPAYVAPAALSWDERAAEACRAIEAEFGVGRFEFILTAPPFVVAVERTAGIRRGAGPTYAALLGGLHDRFMSTFQTPMRLPHVTRALPVLLFAPGGIDLGGLAGRYESRAGRTLMIDDPREGPRVLAHEATHQLVDALAPGAVATSWLEEGVAMLFETGGEPVRPNHARRAGWRERPRIRLQELTGLTRESFWERVPREDAEWARDCYAESWALAYYLLLKHRAAFHTLFRLELEGRGGAAAFEREIRRATGWSLDRFEAEWLHFMRSSS